MCRLALVLTTDPDSGNAPEVISRILPWAIDQQIVLFVNQVLPVKLAHLEVRRQLDGVRRASLFAQTAEDTTREIDTEELRMPAPVFVLCRLQRDAIDRAGNRAQVARHTALTAVRIARKNDPASVARREIRLLLRILNGDSFLEGMEKNVPNRPKYADHRSAPTAYFTKHDEVSSRVQNMNQIVLSVLSIL